MLTLSGGPADRTISTRVGVPRVFFPQDQDGLALAEKTLADVLKEKG